MEQLREFVITGNASETVERVNILIQEGQSPEMIMSEALIPAMDIVGDLFQEGEYFIPEMLVAARAMQRGVDILKPLMITSGGIEPIGKAVIGTKEVVKNLRLGKLSKVFLTINCPAKVKEDIKHYAKLTGAEVIQLKQPNDELGVLCKKQFSISMLGLIKGA